MNLFALPVLVAMLIGDPLPRTEADLVTVTGAPVEHAATPGRITVIDFFATWCGPCRLSMPALARLHAKYGERVDFVSVAEEEDPRAAARFATDMKVKGRVLVDRYRRAFDAFGAHELPTTYVVDGKGVVRHINNGFGPEYEKRMEGWLESLLKE